MAIEFSRPDPASPASVSSAQFPTSRRGYDQAEVRDFLRMVAAEQARLQERERFLERELKAAQENSAATAETIDEETATRLLGEEAARVLQTAREAAAQIKVRSEEAAARLLREAHDEAQRVREEAEVEAARRRRDAAADSESELQMAKQQGRDMVNEARAYRERVLSELARRRELARQQIEQLIHGRDRLLQAFERSRVAAVEVMAELAPLDEPNEYVNLSPTTGPVPMMVPNDGYTAGDGGEFQDEPTQALTALPPDADPASDEAPAEEPRADLRIVPEPAVEDEQVEAVVDDTGEEAPPEEPVAGERAVEETAAEKEAGKEAPAADLTDHDDEPDTEDEGGQVVALFAGEVEQPAAPPSTAKPVSDSVNDLFARLRASRAEAVAKAAESSRPPVAPITSELHVVPDVPAPTAPPPTGEPAPAGSVGGVDEVVVPIIVSAARKLKRVLADEQNDLLDTLRRKEPVRSLDALLPWEADQSAKYAAAIEDDLLAAAGAGAQGDANGRNPAIVRPSIDAVTNEIVAPLRDRLIRCIDKADGDNGALGDAVRTLYREWKAQRIDDHVEDIVRLAYDRGALTIASR
jgi:DivIVA domain-containing protein